MKQFRRLLGLPELTGLCGSQGSQDPSRLNILNLEVITNPIATINPLLDVTFINQNVSDYDKMILTTNVVNGCNIVVTNMVVDSKNNIIIVGTSIMYPTTIYNAANNVNTTLPNNYADSFIIKYNSNGEVLWTTRISNNNTTSIYGVTTDSNDNIIITGLYENEEVTIYNQPGIISTIDSLSTNQGINCCFIIKYNCFGTAIWVSLITGTDGNY